MIKRVMLLSMIFVLAFPCLVMANSYLWQRHEQNSRSIASQIHPPAGFKRTALKRGTFADWLRHLPLKRNGTPVFLYNGTPKSNQNVHAAVIDIDTGTENLQQCADAIIRLRAEYLYSRNNFAAIHFNFTNGDKASFIGWISGLRPIVTDNKVTWVRRAARDASYSSFREYLRTVFTYAGTQSLSQELKDRKDINNIQIGDVFIQGGFPGHAVIVVDMARNPRTGEKVFLLAQSYMPAQDMAYLEKPE